MRSWHRISLLAGLPLLIQYAHAQGVPDAIHKKCIEARDYSGCVQSFQGSRQENAPKTQINIDGGVQASGNSCPGGHAYSGGGYCRNVVCKNPLNHRKELKENGWKCDRFLGMLIGGALDWGDSYIRATINPNCPNREPNIGANDSCKSKYPDQ